MCSISPVDHPPRDDRRLEQVAAVLRVDRAPARLADLVAGTADALQAAADTAPGDSTWTTRSTAPMSMPSSRLLVATMAAQVAALELVLDDDPLLAGERAVVRLDQVAPRFAGSGSTPSSARRPAR